MPPVMSACGIVQVLIKVCFRRDVVRKVWHGGDKVAWVCPKEWGILSGGLEVKPLQGVIARMLELNTDPEVAPRCEWEGTRVSPCVEME